VTSKFIKLIPLSKLTITKALTKAPEIVPIPPEKFVPPMMAATL
jgi:hypothetical protein